MGDLAFINHRVFQGREAFRQNAYAIARLQRDARVWGAEQNGIARTEGGEFAQGAQQFCGIALQVSGVPVVRFPAVNFGDDGQVINVVEGGQLSQRTKAVAAFGLDRRAIKTLFRQAHLVGKRVTGDVLRRLVHGNVTRRFTHNQRYRGTA